MTHQTRTVSRAMIATMLVIAGACSETGRITDQPSALEERGDAGRPVSEPSETPVATDDTTSKPRSVDLAWEQGVVPETPDGFVRLVSDGHSFYWLGDRVHVSADGHTWTEIDVPEESSVRKTLPHDVDAVADGRLITAVTAWNGSGWSDIPPAAVLVEVVETDGSTLTTTLSAASAGPDDPTVLTTTGDATAAIGPAGIVVATWVDVLDLGQLISEALGVDPSTVRGIRPLHTGEHEVFVVEADDGFHRIRPNDHGTTDSHELELGSTPVGWYSADGTSWSRVPASGPFAENGQSIVTVTATDTGFVAIDEVGRGWVSSDGLTWREIGGLTDPFQAYSTGAVGNQLILAGLDSGIQAVSEAGVEILMAEADPRTMLNYSFGAGRAGIAYLVDVDPDADPPFLRFDIVYTPDGASWKRQPLPADIGEIYCCFFDAYGLAVGSESVAVLARGDSGLDLWLGSPTQPVLSLDMYEKPGDLRDRTGVSGGYGGRG